MWEIRLTASGREWPLASHSRLTDGLGGTTCLRAGRWPSVVSTSIPGSVQRDSVECPVSPDEVVRVTGARVCVRDAADSPHCAAAVDAREEIAGYLRRLHDDEAPSGVVSAP